MRQHPEALRFTGVCGAALDRAPTAATVRVRRYGCRIMAEPTRAEVDALSGTTLLEFGASWCPICQAARPWIDDFVRAAPQLRHLRVEDGKGRPLGRSFRVKLWPTLIVMRDGQEVGRTVRPGDASELRGLLSS